MNIKGAEILSKLDHHAYLVVGGQNEKNEIKRLLSKNGFDIKSNPDFVERDFENLTIDDARELKDQSATKPSAVNSKKIFLISFDSITGEAQNALLKLLEEPNSDVHFILIARNSNLLLPTVKWRLYNVLLSRDLEDSAEDNESSAKFIKAKPAKRLEIIKDLLDDITKEKKSKRDVLSFLDGVEIILNEKGPKENKEFLTKLMFVRKYLNDRSSSLKMLLEYLSV